MYDVLLNVHLSLELTSCQVFLMLNILTFSLDPHYFRISKPAPDFQAPAVVNGKFEDIKLSDYKGKYVVLFFYPLDFTFVCPTEIIAFNDRIAEFRKLNTEVSKDIKRILKINGN